MCLDFLRSRQWALCLQGTCCGDNRGRRHLRLHLRVGANMDDFMWDVLATRPPPKFLQVGCPEAQTGRSLRKKRTLRCPCTFNEKSTCKWARKFGVFRRNKSTSGKKIDSTHHWTIAHPPKGSKKCGVRPFGFSARKCQKYLGLNFFLPWINSNKGLKQCPPLHLLSKRGH